MGTIDSINELKNPQYIKPIEINYTQEGKKKKVGSDHLTRFCRCFIVA